VPQRLNSTLLSEISVLAKIKMAGRRLLKIFFVWQLEFNQILMADDNKGMLEEVAAAERLEPPSETDIETYIDHRLAVAGCKREVFTLESSESIYRHTLGLASTVNALCDNYILSSFLSKTSYINTDIIERCSRKIQMPFKRPLKAKIVLQILIKTIKPIKIKQEKSLSNWKISAGIYLLISIFLAESFIAYLCFADAFHLSTIKNI
jgi:hypothetical protein